MRRGSGTRVVATSPGSTHVQSVTALSELIQYPDTGFGLVNARTVTLAHAQATRLSLRVGSTRFRIAGLRPYTSQHGRVFETTISIRPEDWFVYSLVLSRDWNTRRDIRLADEFRQRILVDFNTQSSARRHIRAPVDHLHRVLRNVLLEIL